MKKEQAFSWGENNVPGRLVVGPVAIYNSTGRNILVSEIGRTQALVIANNPKREIEATNIQEITIVTSKELERIIPSFKEVA